MANGIPTKPPTVTVKDWLALVRQSFGDDWHKPETAYEFISDRDGTKIRRIDDSGGASGIYSGTGGG